MLCLLALSPPITTTMRMLGFLFPLLLYTTTAVFVILAVYAHASGVYRHPAVIWGYVLPAAALLVCLLADEIGLLPEKAMRITGLLAAAASVVCLAVHLILLRRRGKRRPAGLCTVGGIQLALTLMAAGALIADVL